MHHNIYAEEIKGKAYDRQLLLRFVRYVAPYRAAILGVLSVLPLVAFCRLSQPWIIRHAIDDHIITGQLQGLWLMAMLFIGVLLTEALLSFLEVFLLQSVGQRVMADMREELFRHVINLPVAWFDHNPTGGTVTRLTSDIEVLGEMFASGIITIIGDILLLIGIISAMLWMDLKLSMVTFSVIPLLFGLAWLFRHRTRQSFRVVRARLGSLNGYLAEAINGISVIQAFNRQRDEQQRFTELNSSCRDANKPVIFWEASLYAMVEALASVAVALVLWYGGLQIVGGALSFGVLVAFIQYIDKFFAPVRDLSAKYSVMQGAMAALERIFALLDTEKPLRVTVDRYARHSTKKTTDTDNGHGLRPLIEFHSVTFAYRDGENALDDFSLKVGRGEKVALVGESGGGKTTIARLLSRLYETGSGSILINGRDIRSMPLIELRRRIGVVLQDPCLFAGSIAFNICLGDGQAASRMQAAAAAVGAAAFIERLPQGYDQPINERGSNLSAGEKQLISFARAVAFDPEILVLDEATASIDTRSEQMIKQGLKGLMQGRTAIVIAHRLSTIQDADRIVVVHSGRKIEEGTHFQLMQAGGLYHRLHQLQFGL
ncbi:MAG TPA: ABC transporter ATP-binding protein [Deltaproteobacteria bacterium]|nr:ABC transporter ATP-binding protein [Deltaproteobacteria bacterium]